MQKIRIVNYAINGVGMGHITRLLSISRWMRSLLKQLGVEQEILFVTTSEADLLLSREGFPAFKVPSKKVIEAAGMAYDTFAYLARDWMWNSLDLLRPDLLVVDTLPAGSFGEFLPNADFDVLRSCQKRVFIYRPVKAETALKRTFQSALRQYDSILVPEVEETAPVYVPDVLRSRLRFLGPIISCDQEHVADRDTALRELGLPSDKLNIFVSTGGGGFPTAEDNLFAICNAFADDMRIHLSVAAGPLYRGNKLRASNITWLSVLGISSYMRAFDMAISAVGYNTFNELMHLGIPTIFIPLDARSDDQKGRALRAVGAGAAQILEAADREGLTTAVSAWMDPAARISVSAKARAVVPTNYARHAAVDILSTLLPEVKKVTL